MKMSERKRTGKVSLSFRECMDTLHVNTCTNHCRQQTRQGLGAVSFVTCLKRKRVCRNWFVESLHRLEALLKQVVRLEAEPFCLRGNLEVSKCVSKKKKKQAMCIANAYEALYTQELPAAFSY